MIKEKIRQEYHMYMIYIYIYIYTWVTSLSKHQSYVQGFCTCSPPSKQCQHFHVLYLILFGRQIHQWVINIWYIYIYIYTMMNILISWFTPSIHVTWNWSKHFTDLLSRIQRQDLRHNILNKCPGDALVLEVTPGLPPSAVFLDTVSAGFEASTARRSANLDGAWTLLVTKEYNMGTWQGRLG